MDPGARRYLWNTLSDFVKAGRLIVLTSHSMEECEALCTRFVALGTSSVAERDRLAIMVNGKFKCLGSVQHIKTKFGKGFLLMAKVQPDAAGKAGDTKPVKDYIEANFPGAVFDDEHYGEVHYKVGTRAVILFHDVMRWQITSSSIPLSELFAKLEAARLKFDLADQSISQTTLEQVFVGFAKDQHVDASAAHPAASQHRVGVTAV